MNAILFCTVRRHQFRFPARVYPMASQPRPCRPEAKASNEKADSSQSNGKGIGTAHQEVVYSCRNYIGEIAVDTMKNSILIKMVLTSALFAFPPLISADVEEGRQIYTTNCASCHGDSGESIPPGGNSAIDIFAVAKTNPWQFLHKVRFASSGTEMPSLVGLPGTNLQQALDVLSYAQAEFAKRL